MSSKAARRLVILVCMLMALSAVGCKTQSANDVVGEEITIYENGNIAGVSSQPTSPTTFTIDNTYKVTYIANYHYFNKGALPGTISLRHQDGTVYGPWQTEGVTGQGNVQNAYWVARPNQEIKAGKYTVVDSDPSTWSQNSQSNHQGFTQIKGFKLK